LFELEYATSLNPKSWETFAAKAVEIKRAKEVMARKACNTIILLNMDISL
jgi:hypothetical protein